ncbi:MAG: hypothetical protein EA379_09540 [Phycisphaerales bacterium]|nr:MAG: hypothetical protein EA379_09540 [Phycisphaerales bacterium]
MPHTRRETIDVPTDGSGAADVRFGAFNGLVLSVEYVKAAADSYADGVDFAITGGLGGQSIWAEDDVDASKSVAPVRAGSLTDGSDSAMTEMPIGLHDEPVRIVIANGGANRTGRFIVTVV